MSRIEFHLRIQVKLDCLETFFDFLGDAIPFYEQPGGIRIRLLQNHIDPTRFIELVEYADEKTFQQDQHRVQTDPEMKGYLERWHRLLEREPEIEIYRPVDPHKMPDDKLDE